MCCIIIYLNNCAVIYITRVLVKDTDVNKSSKMVVVTVTKIITVKAYVIGVAIDRTVPFG